MIPLNELVLAYELHCEGCRWKLIARHLSHDCLDLQSQVNTLKVRGLPKLTKARMVRGLEPKENNIQ